VRIELFAKRAVSIVAVAMAAIVLAQGATHSLKGLIDAVLRRGSDAQLPLHLSAVLGVGAIAERAAVKQAVIRDGSTIRSFNVCTANPDNVVILTHDEQSQSTKAYLMSAAGSLRKAVDYHTGTRANERSLAEARSEFAVEMKFWTDFSVP